MSNRSVVEHALTVYFDGSSDPGGMAQNLLDRLLAERAHELAEKIRANKVREPEGEVEEHLNWVLDELANEIDPKKEGAVTEETITISKRYYEELVERSTELAALDAYGVDNWEGYGDAMRSLEEDD